MKELKGFKKVALKAGETKTVEIPIDARSFAFYDPERKTWIAEAGDYRLLIGASSRDIRSKLDLRRAQTETLK